MHMLGAQPLYGRLLLPEDDRPGKQPVALLTYALWQRLFSADPAIVGRAINLNGNSFTVVGVLRPAFLLNHEIMPTVGAIEKAEMLLSLALPANGQDQRGSENFNIMARLKSGTSPQQAQADIDLIAARIREADKRDPSFTISVVPLQQQVVGNVKRAVLVLLGSVALVLLIACANVANLLLSRATGRQKEIAIRTALGAGGGRLVRQLLTESVLLGVLGGAAGVAIAMWGLYVVRTINPGNIPRLEAISLDGGVLAFTFAISILTGLVFGLAPALRAANVDLNSALKAGGRSSQGAGGFALSRHRLRGLLVTTEIAFSLMLLIGAGLLVRSFVRLQNVTPGFNPDHVISARTSFAGPKYRDRKVVGRIFEDLTTRLARVPGIQSAGAVSSLPFTSSVGWGGLQIEGYVPPANEPELQVDKRAATTGYFRTMEIPLLKGRYFNEHDVHEAPPVAIIDDKMAQRFWPRDNPIGKRIRNGNNPPWVTIVGVAGTVKQYGLDQDLRMVVYSPHAQDEYNGMYVVARASVDPSTLAGALVREVHAIDPDVPLFDVRTMPDRIYDSLARQRFAMTMLAAFAAFAMLLGGVGIYGVMSYLVTQGAHDIGVRIALGAPRGSILSMVVRQGMAMAGAGIAAGLIGGARRLRASWRPLLPRRQLLTGHRRPLRRRRLSGGHRAARQLRPRLARDPRGPADRTLGRIGAKLRCEGGTMHAPQSISVYLNNALKPMTQDAELDRDAALPDAIREMPDDVTGHFTNLDDATAHEIETAWKRVMHAGTTTHVLYTFTYDAAGQTFTAHEAVRPIAPPDFRR